MASESGDFAYGSRQSRRFGWVSGEIGICRKPTGVPLAFVGLPSGTDAFSPKLIGDAPIRSLQKAEPFRSPRPSVWRADTAQSLDTREMEAHHPPQKSFRNFREKRYANVITSLLAVTIIQQPMKTPAINMKPIAFSSLLALMIFSGPVLHADQYHTLVSGQTLSLDEGQTALVIFGVGTNNGTGGLWPLVYTPSGGSPLTIVLRKTDTTPTSSGSPAPSPLNALPLVGPATLSIGGADGVYGIRIVSTVHNQNVTTAVDGTPSNAVVIPSDANGSVSIILETSTDLITWTAANPGTYGASTPNRFFRVRAVANN